jgi:dienelactone hydrolase
VQAMMMDLEAAYGWLEKQAEIDPKRIGMVGSSVSANLVIRYAAINDQLAALVLLSPSLDNAYKLRTDDAIKRIGNIPIRFIVSRNDSFYFNSAKRLLAIRHEMGLPVTDDQLVVCTGPLHGTDMLVGVKTLPNQVIDFLEASLKQPPLPSAPAPQGTPAPTPPAGPSPAPAP